MVLSSGSTLPSRSLRIGSYGGPCKQSQQRVNTCVCGLAREPRPQWCSGTCGRSAQSSGCLRRMRTSCAYEHFFEKFCLNLNLASTLPHGEHTFCELVIDGLAHVCEGLAGRDGACAMFITPTCANPANSTLTCVAIARKLTVSVTTPQPFSTFTSLFLYQSASFPPPSPMN